MELESLRNLDRLSYHRQQKGVKSDTQRFQAKCIKKTEHNF